MYHKRQRLQQRFHVELQLKRRHRLSDRKLRGVREDQRGRKSSGDSDKRATGIGLAQLSSAVSSRGCQIYNGTRPESMRTCTGTWST